MADLPLIPCLTAAAIVGYFLVQVVTRRFDPFAPTWLFLVGYVHVYVLQAISYHSWAVAARGEALVDAADWRALWCFSGSSRSITCRRAAGWRRHCRARPSPGPGGLLWRPCPRSRCGACIARGW